MEGRGRVKEWGQFPTSLSYIPIDFFKAQVIGLSADDFLNNNNLKFTTQVDRNSGEIKFDYAILNNIKVKIFPSNRIEISGSLHIYWNDGKHNHNDFDLNAFFNAIERLKNDFGVMPHHLRLLTLEVGFNVTPPIPTNDIINHLHYHINKRPTSGIDCKNVGRYLQFTHTAYILKIYNKGLQYHLPNHLIRIEIKLNSSSFKLYRIIGITTLEDFINADKIIFLNKLVQCFQEVVYYSEKNNEKTESYQMYDTSNYWEKLRTKSRDTFKKHRDKLMHLNRTIGGNEQTKIIQSIIEKAIQLNCDRGGLRITN